jgi:hypothetical protein
LSGFEGALACAAAGGASGAAAACAVPAPAGFLRRRRRRLRDAGRSDPPSGEGVGEDVISPSPPSATSAASAALSFPAPSSAALGFDVRRRERARERPPAWLFFFGSPVDPAASFSAVPAAPPPSALESASPDGFVLAVPEPRPRPLLPRRRWRVRGRDSVDPSSAEPAWGSGASSVMPRSFPPRGSGAPSRSRRGASGVALGDAGLRGCDRHVLAPCGHCPHLGLPRIELGFDRGTGARPGWVGSVGGGQEHSIKDTRGVRRLPGLHLNRRMWMFSNRPTAAQFVSMAVPP